MNTKDLRILVVDDEEFNRKILVRLLNRYGYLQIETAGTGKEALVNLNKDAFDCILLDISMPDLDGYEVLGLIQGDELMRDIPVIMITGIEDKDSVIRCIELGAADYLQKPIDPVLLKARLDASLEKKLLQDKQLEYLNLIEVEKQRVDQLLNNILPSSAVQELKATGKVPPRRYDDVAVLFCDIIGFTQFCDNHTAEEVVGGLQELFEAYETITHNHGLEKIKTIGDEFMLAANLTIPRKDPLLSAIACGLEMIEATVLAPNSWTVRIGIDFGPVVAGIVGHDKYHFDLWGNTVNTASRMAGIGSTNSIVLPANAWPSVSNRCIGKLIGPVDIKGKGTVEVVEVLSLENTQAAKIA